MAKVKYSYNQKFNYYNSRRNLSNKNKSAYANGFIDEALSKSSVHQHKSDIEERKSLLKELKNSKDLKEKTSLVEAISYYSGIISSYKSYRHDYRR